MSEENHTEESGSLEYTFDAGAEPAKEGIDLNEADEELTTTQELAEKLMLGKLTSIIVDMAKALPDVWQKLSEDKQREWIDYTVRGCRDAARDAINVLACGNTSRVPCVVDSVTFKDGVKVVMKVSQSHQGGAHDIADHEGQTVLVVIPDMTPVESEQGVPEPDPDQNPLNLDDDMPDAA